MSSTADGSKVFYVPGVEDFVILDPEGEELRNDILRVFESIDRERVVRVLNEERSTWTPRDAHELACFFAGILTRLEEPLPLPLQAYILESIHPRGRQRKRKRGRAPYANLARDVAIANAVETACAAANLPPMRNDASEGASGCTITAEALRRTGTEISAKRVAEIYRKVRDLKIETAV